MDAAVKIDGGGMVRIKYRVKDILRADTGRIDYVLDVVLVDGIDPFLNVFPLKIGQVFYADLKTAEEVADEK